MITAYQLDDEKLLLNLTELPVTNQTGWLTVYTPGEVCKQYKYLA